jgi:hypothetical protein
MSDTTQPPAQPTPPPADSGTGEGAAPPPPPAEPHDGAATPPPPPEQKKSRGLLVPLVAVAVVLVLAAAAVGVVLATRGGDSHEITTPSTAGDMKRDTKKETELKPQLDAAEQQFKTQAKGVSYVKSAVYDQDDADRGPEGPLVFLGAKLTTKQSPNAFVKSFGEQAGANGFKVTKVPAGDGGGKAVCASQEEGDEKVAICAWATADSMGELVPTVPGYDAETLSKIMVDLRPDVEKSE